MPPVGYPANPAHFEKRDHWIQVSRKPKSACQNPPSYGAIVWTDMLLRKFRHACEVIGAASQIFKEVKSRLNQPRRIRTPKPSAKKFLAANRPIKGCDLCSVSPESSILLSNAHVSTSRPSKNPKAYRPSPKPTGPFLLLFVGKARTLILFVIHSISLVIVRHGPI